MNRRDKGGRRRPVTVALVGACVALLTAGCTGYISGRAVSMMYDPFHVGGLPVTDGPSGPRPGAPAPTGTVQNTDNGPIDQLALLSVTDIEEYWQQNYHQYFQGDFVPIETLISYDSKIGRAHV